MLYEDNYKNIILFYKSEYFKYLELNNPKLIDKIFKGIYEDPDLKDRDLYKMLGEKYNLLNRSNYLVDIVDNKKIKMGADFIIGIEEIKNNTNNIFECMKIYKKLRTNLMFYFIWPRHKLPTINTLRYSVYRDRFDLFLFDIKQYFNGIDTPLNAAYENGTTKIWLSKFNNDFQKFIDGLHLKIFVNDNYEVKNITDNSIITSLSAYKNLNDFEIRKYINTLLNL